MPHDGTTEASGRLFNQVLIEKTFPSDFRWVRRAIHEAEQALGAAGLASEDIGSVSIILAEALNNIVEHAYPQGEEGEIRVVIRKRNASLMFEIGDWGRPMPKGRAPMGNHPMSEFHQDDAMPEGGYGWFLIRELVRDLVYDRRDDQNLLLFRFGTGEPQ